MGFVNQSYDEIVEKVIRELSRTQLTALNEKSNIRKFVDPILARLRDQSLEYNQNLSTPMLSGASDDFLDLVGETRGLPRTAPEKAAVNAVDRNLKFGTLVNFGTINGGEDIYLPPGVLIGSTAEFEEGSAVFSLREGITLPAAEREVYVSADALNLGEEFNVGAESLVFHDFENYAESKFGTLFVTNDFAITNGASIQSDAEYKYFIKYYSSEEETSNPVAVRTALLKVPGVVDAIRVPFARGIGTSDWVIISKTVVPSDSLIDRCNQVILSVGPDAGSVIAVKAPITSFNLSFFLTYNTALSSEQKAEVKRLVRNELSKYINNLALGGSFIPDQALKVILGASSTIESVGRDGGADFEYIYVTRVSEAESLRIREKIIGKYIASSPVERLIIDPGDPDAIEILDLN